MSNSHYDPSQPGQYTPPFPENQRPGKYPKKKMPLGVKIALVIFAVPVVVVGGCTAVMVGSGAAQTVADQADKTPVISTTSPVPTVRETPRAPKPVEEAPTDPPTVAKPTRTAPARTAGQTQAIGAAEQYLQVMPFSRKGLIQQLSSAAGEGFSRADATFAVDHITVDWNAQATKSARQYLTVSHFSRAGLVHQLESEAGEGFTHAQAVFGVKAVGL